MHGEQRAGTGTEQSVRGRILDAALVVLSESGIQGFTQVEVATRAGVRQSHLTYYFPTRDDLLAAVTEAAIQMMGAGIRELVGKSDLNGGEQWLERLARSVCEMEHMRMFLSMIVEADGNAGVRKMLVAGTRRMEGVVAEALGGEDAMERARLILGTVWGYGMYLFLVRPKSQSLLLSDYASWLVRISDQPATTHNGTRSGSS